MSSEMSILTNVIDKLDTMDIDFDITDIDIIPALNDALREMKIQSLSSITDNSQTELYIELRTEYWMLHRFRNAQTLNFKYSTSIDGRMIDKTMIPKLISDTMAELDNKFASYMTNTFNKSASGTWNITRKVANRLT